MIWVKVTNSNYVMDLTWLHYISGLYDEVRLVVASKISCLILKVQYVVLRKKFQSEAKDLCWKIFFFVAKQTK